LVTETVNNPESFDSFKWATLDEATAGAPISEPLIDASNWFPGAAQAELAALSERAMRDLYAEGYIYFRRRDADVAMGREEVDSMLTRGGWRDGRRDEPVRPRRQERVDHERRRVATHHEAGLRETADLQPFDQVEASAGRSLA